VPQASEAIGSPRRRGRKRRVRADPPALDFLDGGVEMATLIRSIDWTATPLGAFEKWPQSLRTAASICLTSRFPLSIWWGPAYVLLYAA
jgi:hypothetical protein